MKKVLKTIANIFGILLLSALLLVLVVYIYHSKMLSIEEPLLEDPIGQLVEVDGHNMCVYEAGTGDHTLLLLSGSGTPAPILDFKCLYSLLENDFRIVVIEKYGYGFSDIVDTERSFDTILRQDREALSKLGIEGPFILCPHSMSGLEAILWAQDYPSEVEGIIGLDMALPKFYEVTDLDASLRSEKLIAIARAIGFTRFYYTGSNLPPDLTKEEKELYQAIAARNTVNVDVYNEGVAIPDAVSKIRGKQMPDIPMILFASNGEGTGTATDIWRGIQREFASGLADAKVIEFDSPHYLHYSEAQRIADEIRSFAAFL